MPVSVAATDQRSDPHRSRHWRPRPQIDSALVDAIARASIAVPGADA
jgi:hypothetical protein